MSSRTISRRTFLKEAGVVAGAQIIGMVTALLGGAITARLGSKWVLACGLTLSGRLSRQNGSAGAFFALTLPAWLH